MNKFGTYQAPQAAPAMGGMDYAPDYGMRDSDRGMFNVHR